ncbi:MAG: hypothetical protein WBM17_17045 [Anaerolineales bacterium]
MKCWGWNYFGQLGDRSMTTQVKPVSVAELPGPAAAMGLGWRQTCAVIDPGLVICWSANEYGQGWDGWLVEPDGPAATPTVIPGDEKSSTPADTPAGPPSSDVQYQPMDSGGYHNCAVTKQGGVKCWGANDGGQMGIGDAGAQSVPVDVIGLTGEAVGVAVGGNHSCALMRSGDVMCWGANYSGEIGDGTQIDRKHPALVLGFRAARRPLRRAAGIPARWCRTGLCAGGRTTTTNWARRCSAPISGYRPFMSKGCLPAYASSRRYPIAPAPSSAQGESCVGD